MAQAFICDVIICYQVTYAETLNAITARNAGYDGLKVERAESFPVSLCELFGIKFCSIFGIMAVLAP
jgi:hypothetical protein